MKIFITCLGTAGDLNPFLSVGAELSARGHHVTVLSDAGKEGVIRAAGLGFAEVLSLAEWERAVSLREFWSAETCMQTVYQYLYLPSMLPILKFITANQEPGNTVLLAAPGAIGPKIAQDKLRLPLVHMSIAPYHIAQAKVPAPADQARHLLSLLNGFRRLLKLPAIAVPLHEWLFAADLRVACFPSWFCEAEAKTPGLTCTDFVFSDEISSTHEPEALAAFLRAGRRPLAFTAGTGARYATEFFEAAVRACESLKVRAVFLSTGADQLPRHLPATVFHSRFASLGQLLPSVDGIVHHGGVGTCAQAMRAGVFQLIRPGAFDQFHNAERIEALGVGMTAADSNLSSTDLADQIRSLQESAAVRQRCADVAQLLQGADARAALANLIESALRARVEAAVRSTPALGLQPYGPPVQSGVVMIEPELPQSEGSLSHAIASDDKPVSGAI
jgi:rhamnosyltransferase subunit B